MKSHLLLFVLLFQLVFTTFVAAQDDQSAERDKTQSPFVHPTTSTPTTNLAAKELQLGLSYILSLGGTKNDLKMDDEQIFALSHLWLDVKMEIDGAIREHDAKYSENLPADEIEQLKASVLDSIKQIRVLEMNEIESILSEDQIARLKQIQFQYLRRNTNGMDSLKEQLNLDDRQLTKMKEITAATRKETLEFVGRAKEMKISQQEMTDHLHQIREQKEERLLGVLSDSQKRTLKSLEGETFQFQMGGTVKQDADDKEGE